MYRWIVKIVITFVGLKDYLQWPDGITNLCSSGKNGQCKGCLSYSYSYDPGGNITSVCEYNYTTGTLPLSSLLIREYGYDDPQWKDLLTFYNGSTIDYDEIGNMISYNDSTYSWNGRKLEEITSGDNHYSYSYNANGIRTSKTVNGITTEYFLNGDQILAEKTGDDVIWYFYDVLGQRIGLMRNNTTYYYLYDLTGNVIALVKGVTGNVAATYTYDAWGDCAVQNVGSETIGTVNPFRYKSYYYDQETGFCYLNDRYYACELGRLISADTTDVLDVQSDLYDKNLYAYCDNNPVMRMDSTGAIWHLAVGAFVGLGAVQAQMGKT